MEGIEHQLFFHLELIFIFYTVIKYYTNQFFCWEMIATLAPLNYESNDKL